MFARSLDAIADALHALEVEGVSVVVGDGRLAASRYFAEVPAHRRIASALCALVAGRLVVGGGFDTQCGFKGSRADVADDLFGVSRIDRFAIDAELLHVARLRGYAIRRIPVRLRCQEGASVRLLRDGLALLRDLLRIRWHRLRGGYGRRARAIGDGSLPRVR